MAQPAYHLFTTIDEIKRVSSVEEALAIQDRIEPLVQILADEKDPDEEESWLMGKSIIALDIAYSTSSNLAVASGVLYRINDQDEKNEKIKGEFITERFSSGQATFPYQPGLLAFREIPLLVKVIEELLILVEVENIDGKKDNNSNQDDIILLCDGAGIAHPRFCGLACHLGVLFQCCSIGVAKNHLIGEFDETSLDSNRSSYSLLYIKSRIVGNVLRSQNQIRPIFVSPGHLISIDRARQLVLHLCHKYRLPEPIRRADHIGRMELKRLEQGEIIKEVAKPKSKSIIHGQRKEQQGN